MIRNENKITSPRVKHGKFISPKELDDNLAEGWISNISFKDYRLLWRGENSINNPCPNFFRVPTSFELLDEITNQENGAMVDAYNSFLKIPHAGIRYLNGKIDTYE